MINSKTSAHEIDTESCKRCGDNVEIEKHHVLYIPEVCIGLCSDCHRFAHENPESQYAPRQDPNELFTTQLNSVDVPERANVTIKRINSNSYFYWNWREGKNIKSKYICSVQQAENHDAFCGEPFTDRSQGSHIVEEL